MSQIKYVDTDGNKSRLLPFRYFGLDNHPAGGDIGRVYIGTGSENIPLAKKSEVTALANTGVQLTGNQTINGIKTFSSTIVGNITGNAGSATKLQTARSIALAGDVTGSATFDGSANVSITTAVADNSHNHTIANITSLQTTLNDKANLASPALTGTPTAPTAEAATNNTQIATTAFVQANKTAVNATSVASGTAGIAVGAVGSYAFLWHGASTHIPGATLAGSSLTYSCTVGAGGTMAISTPAVSGSWRLMGCGSLNSATVWLRIA